MPVLMKDALASQIGSRVQLLRLVRTLMPNQLSSSARVQCNTMFDSNS